MYHMKFLLGAITPAFIIGCSHSSKTNIGSDINKQQPPKLTKPVARRIWIEPQVLENGSVYIDGHWKYLIQKESTWTR